MAQASRVAGAQDRARGDGKLCQCQQHDLAMPAPVPPRAVCWRRCRLPARAKEASCVWHLHLIRAWPSSPGRRRSPAGGGSGARS